MRNREQAGRRRPAAEPPSTPEVPGPSNRAGLSGDPQLPRPARPSQAGACHAKSPQPGRTAAGPKQITNPARRFEAPAQVTRAAGERCSAPGSAWRRHPLATSTECPAATGHTSSSPSPSWSRHHLALSTIKPGHVSSAATGVLVKAHRAPCWTRRMTSWARKIPAISEPGGRRTLPAFGTGLVACRAVST